MCEIERSVCVRDREECVCVSEIERSVCVEGVHIFFPQSYS